MQVRSSIASYIARGYYMVSEVNQKPGKIALRGIECPIMQWEGDNPKKKWRRLKQHFELMFTGPLKSRTEQNRRNAAFH